MNHQAASSSTLRWAHTHTHVHTHTHTHTHNSPALPSPLPPEPGHGDQKQWGEARTCGTASVGQRLDACTHQQGDLTRSSLPPYHWHASSTVPHYHCHASVNSPTLSLSCLCQQSHLVTVMPLSTVPPCHWHASVNSPTLSLSCLCQQMNPYMGVCVTVVT